MIEEERIANLEQALGEAERVIEYCTLTQIAMMRFMERRFPDAGNKILKTFDRMTQEAHKAGKPDEARMIHAIVYDFHEKFGLPAND